MKHPRRFRGMFLGSVGKQKKGKEVKKGEEWRDERREEIEEERREQKPRLSG